MTNHSIIDEAFQNLREPLAGYILQQLQSIPEYKRDDQWWQDGVIRVLTDFNPRDGLQRKSGLLPLTLAVL